jgi:hypothetical protein
VTISGTFGGSGSISGYSNPTTYQIAATNGTTTATLTTAGVATSSQTVANPGVFTTVNQALTAGTEVIVSANTSLSPSSSVGTYYVTSTNLTSTTCTLATTSGGTPVAVTSSAAGYLIATTGVAAGGTLTTTTGTPTGLTFSVNSANWAGGTTAIGGGEYALGYGGMDTFSSGNLGLSPGILNSVCLSFIEQSPGSDPSNSVGIYTNGVQPYGSQIATGLTFNTTFNVTLTYSGTSLAMTMQATGGGTTFSHTFTGINIPTIVGANTAYVGFTAGSNGSNNINAVTAWTL